jgi:hypothetical protein
MLDAVERVLPQRMPCGDERFLRTLLLRVWKLALFRLGRLLLLRLSPPPQPRRRRRSQPPLQRFQSRSSSYWLH